LEQVEEVGRGLPGPTGRDGEAARARCNSVTAKQRRLGFLDLLPLSSLDFAHILDVVFLDEFFYVFL
jgi:hypothetical protein